jgi:hypothetical protein
VKHETKSNAFEFLRVEQAVSTRQGLRDGELAVLAFSFFPLWLSM